MSEQDLEQITCNLSLSELRLILYWRDACHLYNNGCPLHCIKEGIDYCHKTAKHLGDIAKQAGETKPK